jgi:hypothetical protein
MPGQELRLGPFLGGLNLFSDPSAVADTEMVSCINFEVGIDGSLISRPPMQLGTSVGSGATSIKVLMLFTSSAGTQYLIGSNSGGVYYSTGGAWTLLGSTVQSDCAVQYNNKVWFFPKIGTTNSATWDGTTYTVLSTLPPASAAVIYKERAWCVPGINATTNTARLQYSLTADPNSWNTGDATFIDIQPGDGKKLIDLTIYQDNVMLFKEESTYVLAFDSVPSSSSLKKINNNIGVSGYGCMVPFENQVYVLHHNSIYEILNYTWTKINLKLPPTAAFDNTTPASTSYVLPYFLTLWGDRLLFRYYRKVYSFGLRTRTWSEFQFSTVNNEQWFGLLVKWPNFAGASSGNLDGYFGGSCLNSDLHVYKLYDGYEGTKTESGSGTIAVSMKTKNFDSAYGRRYRIFSFGQRYKKMFWWGADIVTSQSVTGTATPIVTNFSVTWGQAKLLAWNQLNTWQQPIVTITGTATTWASPGINARHFVKFAKAMRYRQINFQIQTTTDGTTNTGPIRLFGIINAMEVKDLVTEGSN